MVESKEQHEELTNLDPSVKAAFGSAVVVSKVQLLLPTSLHGYLVQHESLVRMHFNHTGRLKIGGRFQLK
ncbi:hypothetical protein J1N35_015054 [Gossypium stocksii]|uniref:Uncharacterized protein n=1 Tax=Gossypium stocksii TaxID=47602 RepID=A0A9D4A886_9ROSI|nr:hypothetical protein J1N35_015054 [Gossypium stocksii]